MNSMNSIDFKKLKQEQIKLSKKIIKKDDFDEIRTYGAVGKAFEDSKIIASAIVCDKDMNILDKKYVVKELNFPYISGFLAYREMPPMIEAFNLLKEKPSVLMVNANGILHPRNLGMASHIGLVLDIPTIGIAKKLFVGEIKGDNIILNNKIVGKLVKTREFSKPLIVSIGHRISLKTAVRIVKETTIYPHKLPEPLHIANRYAANIKKDIR